MSTTIDHPQTGSARLRFFPRQLITADDLNQEQRYHREKLREHNRFLHGWGVVCGCDVQLVGGGIETTSQVLICPGYVLTPQGDAIWIRSQAVFDVATCFVQSQDPCAVARPCPPVKLRSIVENTLFLAVRYVECMAQPVRVAPHGCSCDDAQCEYSRVVDTYELCCLTGLPDTHAPGGADCAELLGEADPVPCPDCPADPWVVLARLTLSSSQPVVLGNVDAMSDRRVLASVGGVQARGRCSSRGTTAPWHVADGEVYHDSLFCSEGRRITTQDFRAGTGNLPRCPECAELAGRWPS